MLPNSERMKTWPDEDRAKINPRGKQVAVETEPVWLLFEPNLGWYTLLKAGFSAWGVQTIGFVDALDVIAWLMQLVESKSITDVPQLAVISLDPKDSRIFPETWDWLLQYLHRYEILRGTAIVLLRTDPLSPKQETLLKQRYPRVKKVIYKPLPAMKTLHAMLLEVLQ